VSAFAEIEPALAKHFAESKGSGKKIGSTIDEDQTFESEIIDNRQIFLNYCMSNHCQFDELRRAKHSTVLLLFQLHNPLAPKFLQQCGACYFEIAHGVRYHCNDCANFDLCEDCYKPVVNGSWANRGTRYTHDKSHTFIRINIEASEDLKKSQEERAQALKTHLELLSHIANCDGPPACKLKNCEKMRNMFGHVRSCEVTYQKGCRICTRLLSLLTVHARSCATRGHCSLPFCDRIRERNERLRRQQQLMDDRRRQAQNDFYRGGDRE
jgi:E1A/CREB-binding protein